MDEDQDHQQELMRQANELPGVAAVLEVQRRVVAASPAVPAPAMQLIYATGGNR